MPVQHRMVCKPFFAFVAIYPLFTAMRIYIGLFFRERTLANFHNLCNIHEVYCAHKFLGLRICDMMFFSSHADKLLYSHIIHILLCLFCVCKFAIRYSQHNNLFFFVLVNSSPITFYTNIFDLQCSQSE